MILVTGTKRSGTSMWMQLLHAAGFAVHGERFPRDWARTIRDANPEGFFESPLRRGIYFATNPNPRTGQYLHPEETRDIAVKVFVPGLLRSDLAFLDKVLGTVRHPRAYVRSLERLYAMERENKRRLERARGREPLPSIERVPPWLEWWNDNYSLVRDALRRGYACELVSYDAVLASPERHVERILTWLGKGNLRAALAHVKSSLRTQHAERSCEPSGLPAHVEAVFEELYTRVHEHVPLDTAFLERMSAVHRELSPAILAAQARRKASRKRIRALRAQRAKSERERQARRA